MRRRTRDGRSRLAVLRLFGKHDFASQLERGEWEMAVLDGMSDDLQVML